MVLYALVAQWIRAADFGSAGREFESLRGRLLSINTVCQMATEFATFTWREALSEFPVPPPGDPREEDPPLLRRAAAAVD